MPAAGSGNSQHQPAGPGSGINKPLGVGSDLNSSDEWSFSSGSSTGFESAGVCSDSVGSGGSAWSQARHSDRGDNQQAVRRSPLPLPTELTYTAPSFPTLDITGEWGFDEFMASLKAAKDGAPGPSRITNGLLRALPEPVLRAWWRILSRCIDLQDFPPSFRLGHIYAMPKPGHPSIQNCRPITLMECTLKVLTRSLNWRLMSGLLRNGVFSSFQSGFTPGKDGTDPVYIVKGTLEDARERNLNLHLLLADLEKAFDSVESWSLEESYRWAGLSERTVRLLGALDGRGYARVITPFGLTELHAVLRGVRQGEVLSPTKFILWLEPWLRHAHVLYGHYGHALREGARISHQAMADDVALVSGSGLGMTTLAASFGRFLVFHGVTISGSKSVYGSSDPLAAPIRLPIFKRSSTLTCADIATAVIRPSPPDATMRYLGDQVCLTLRWAGANRAMAPVVQMDVGALAKRKIELTDALAYYSAVTLGKGGYFFPLGRISPTQLQSWDSQLRRILTAKAGMAPSSSSAAIFATKPAGLGVTSLSTLAVAAGVTELVKRLSSPGLLGAVARSRWDSFHRLLAGEESIPEIRPSLLALHHTGYILRLAWRFGIQVHSQSDLRVSFDRLARDHSLVTLMDTDMFRSHLDKVRRSPFRTLEDVRAYVGMTPSPPPLGGGPRSPLEDLPPVYCPGVCSVLQRRCNRCPPRPRRRRRRGLIRVSFAWCWKIARLFLHQGSAIRPCGPLVADACPFLTEITQPEGLPIAGPPLRLQSDGSLNPGANGAFAVICLDTQDPRLRLWPIKDLLLEGGEVVPARYHAIGYSGAGQEDLSIDFLELLACVWVAEKGPPTPVCLDVDASYVTLTLDKVRRGLSNLRWMRLPNSPLWRRLLAALTYRDKMNIPLTIAKCAAHGRDGSQEASITQGNACADSAAKLTAGGGVKRWSPFILGLGRLDVDPLQANWQVWKDSLEGAFYVTLNGWAFRGDPRAGIRRVSGQRCLDHWCGLRSGGAMARILSGGQASAPSLSLTSSRRHLNALGAEASHNILFQLRASSLRDASHMFRSDKGYWPLLSMAGGRPLCTHCDGLRPDAWHTLLECPAFEAPRHLLRGVAGSLLAGASARIQGASPLLDKITRWLRRVFSPLCTLRRVRSHEAKAIQGPRLVDCLPEGGEGPLLHRSPGTLASSLLAGLGRKPLFPTFVLLPGEWIHQVRKELDLLKVRTAIMLAVPSLCWPGYVSPPRPGEDTWFLPDSVWLLVWGSTAGFRCPEDLEVVELSHILRPLLWFGTLGLSFHWRRRSWPLDAVDHPDLQKLLDEWKVLPATPLPRPSLLDTAVLPSHSWVGILPKDRPPILGSVSDKDSKAGKALWASLNVVISAGLGHILMMSRSLTAQELRFRKACAVARFRGRDLPSRQPPFKSWESSSTFFPPSKRILNQALAYLKEGNPAQPSRQSALAYASRNGIPLKTGESLWLAIRYTESRIGPEGVHSIQAEQIPQPPLPQHICIPSRCVMCRGNLVAALIRCAGCGTPRYCSTKCRKSDTVHWLACGHVGLEGKAESADVLSRGLLGDWVMLSPDSLLELIPPRLPRLHPHLGLIYISEGDAVFAGTVPPAGGMSVWQGTLTGDGTPGTARPVGMDPVKPHDEGEVVGKVELVPTSTPPPPPPGSPLPTDPGFEDLVEVTSSGPGLSIESLVAPTPVLSADWYKAPSRFGSRLAAQMVSSRTIPVDIRSLGKGRWVSDAVMDVTCTLLAPHLAPGLRLIPSYMLHSLLSGGDLAARRWAPLLSAQDILMPVVRENHWFLLRCTPGTRTVGVINSLGIYGQDGVVGPISRALGMVSTTGAWALQQIPSPQQTDGHSCGSYTIHSILSVGLGSVSSPPLLSPALLSSLRTAWVLFLTASGIRSAV